MWMLLIVGICAGMGLLFWTIKCGKRKFAFIAAILTAMIAFFLGCGEGATWEALKNYDQYVYHFSQYSRYLHQLVDQQQIAELTNDVVLFDRKFNQSQNPKDLQDVVFQILKVGPYYQETNSEASQASTNHP